jgi:hypothetical protein
VNDLERRLEELFMSDSRARRVGRVRVGARPRLDALRGPAFLGAVALLTIAVIVAFSLLRSPRESVPASSPSATSGVRPDAQHGLMIATGNIRTEDDPRSLQQPSLGMALLPSSNMAISPDGKRVVIIRSAQDRQQIITFTTARPNDLTMVVDLAGTGERATNVVWAGDGSDSILFAAVKDTGSGGGDNFGGSAAWEYSVLRSVDLAKRDVREVARIAGQNTAGVDVRLWPLAWLPARQVAAALEMPQRQTVFNYVLVRNGSVERTAMSPTQPNVASFSASRDGERIVVSMQTSVLWWPVDQPSAAKELPSEPGEFVGHAEFRPGADEIGVRAGGRFEIWTLTGQRRVVAVGAAGFVHWRVDGSAAIASSDSYTAVLIDPATGATTLLPGVGALSDVVMF